MDKYSSRRRSGIEIATKTSQVLENNEQKIEINTEKDNVPGQETVFAGSSTEPSNSFEIVNSDSIEDEPVSEDDSDVFLQINDDSMKEMRSRTKKRVNNTVNEPNVGKYSRKRKLEKYTVRNAGLSYDTLEGKTVRARKMKELKLCRSKCKEKLTEEEREAIFTEYWALGSRDKRAAYVCSLVESTDPATIRKRTNDPDKEKYRMIKVCRGCFMRTLDETNMFVTLATNFNNTSTTSGLNSIDKRGKNSPGNKKSQEIINEIHRHIQPFPAYESHYTRRKSSKKFLPAYLNLNKMNSLYTGALSNPVSRSIYEREFYTLNISFKSPKVDTCHKCDVLAMTEKVCTSEAELQSIKMERTIHQEAADFAYIQKRVDKENSKSDSSTVCYAFDLQQCLPTPFLNSSVSFYKRQLWTYNLTIHDTTSGHVKCYMWHEEEGARGANQIATCLFKELKGLPTKISKVVLYSDSCGGQNRNSHVSAMFLTLQQQCPHFEQIDHKFMVSGHSHLECDVDHGLIEKKKKKAGDAMIPHDWYQLVRTVGKKRKFEVVELYHKDFLDFADMYKNSLYLRKKDSLGNSFKWIDIRWLRYCRQTTGTKLFFKCSLKEEEPFRCLDLHRRNTEDDITLEPKQCYTSSLPISIEKKKDILDLLPLISPIFHDFYKSLKTASSIKCNLPDLDEEMSD